MSDHVVDAVVCEVITSLSVFAPFTMKVDSSVPLKNLSGGLLKLSEEKQELLLRIFILALIYVLGMPPTSKK